MSRGLTNSLHGDAVLVNSPHVFSSDHNVGNAVYVMSERTSTYVVTKEKGVGSDDPQDYGACINSINTDKTDSAMANQIY